MAEERASKKVALEDNKALATLLHTFFCRAAYIQEDIITTSSWLDLYSKVWEITVNVDGAVNLRTFHKTLYADICTAAKLQKEKANFRELMVRIPVLRPVCWERYKALRLLRIFPRDIIWLILSHLKLLWIPDEHLVQHVALSCIGLCGSLQRLGKDTDDGLWGTPLWNNMWQRANAQ
jgi:hypothetical protein